jgi:hypothetical protein
MITQFYREPFTSDFTDYEREPTYPAYRPVVTCTVWQGGVETPLDPSDWDGQEGPDDYLNPKDDIDTLIWADECYHWEES